MGRIEELESRLAMAERGVGKNSLWGVFDAGIKGLCHQEEEAIKGSSSVQSAHRDMMSAFTDYFLFPKFRDEFASIPAFKGLCERYISAVLNAKAEKYSRLNELEKENERLREELNSIKGANQ